MAPIVYEAFDPNGPRLLICGDRNWYDGVLIRLYIGKFRPSVIIQGDASGADKLAKQLGGRLGVPVESYPAKWKEHGTAAGPIRNVQMLKEGKPDIVIGFHNRLEESKGTKHMLDIAARAGIRTIHVYIKVFEDVLHQGNSSTDSEQRSPKP